MKKIMISIILILVGILAILGFFLMNKSYIFPQTPTPSSSKTVTPTEKNTPTTPQEQEDKVEDTTYNIFSSTLPPVNTTVEKKLAFTEKNINLGSIDVVYPEGLSFEKEETEQCTSLLDTTDICYLGLLHDTTSIKGTVWYTGDIVENEQWNQHMKLQDKGNNIFQTEDGSIVLTIDPQTHQSIIYVYSENQG